MSKLSTLHMLLFGMLRLRLIRTRHLNVTWQTRALTPVLVPVPCRARKTPRSR